MKAYEIINRKHNIAQHAAPRYGAVDLAFITHTRAPAKVQVGLEL